MKTKQKKNIMRTKLRLLRRRIGGRWESSRRRNRKKEEIYLKTKQKKNRMRQKVRPEE